MPDSVAVFTPGWRFADNNNDLVTDGIIQFFDAGTTNPKEVFADAALAVSLGTSVACDSAGAPVTSGNVRTLIYVDADPYKVVLTSAIFGGAVFSFDNVRGALDTSNFLTAAAVANIDIVNVSTNRTVTIADKGKLLNVNCSAGTLNITFDPASTLGSGFFVGIRHAGTANQVRITGNGSDLFDISGAATTGFAFTGRGQTGWYTCDGAGFKQDKAVPPLIDAGTPVITVVSQTATPPGAPTAGDRHIVGAGPTGAWSTFAANDIAEATGFGGWFKHTLPSDSGALAYLQNIDSFLSLQSAAWKTPTRMVSTPFGASGTWTKTAGCNYALVIATGGGGGGATNATANRQGGGGGAGATCIALLDISFVASYAVTIGAGGAGGLTGGNNGANGGNTVFGGLFTAGGGGGGVTSLTPGAGGTPSGAQINITGGEGDGIDLSGATSNSGSGGCSFWGGGGGSVGQAGPGRGGAAFGSGGSGAAGTGTSGGSGGTGIVYVLEFGM